MEPHPTLATLRKLEEQLHQLKLNYSARRSGSVVTRIFTAVSLW